ncbi:MAG: ParB/RepB/Spo0J family partition protein, partial [Proteobacteria bacterium]|nr:ParB/RepB/Spo0J family partition protein [Pseudomonadota bacterium]
MLVDIANLRVAAENPRKTRANKLADAALDASMKNHGQLHPLLVIPGARKGLFDVVAGGRRLASAKRIGLKKLEADVYKGKLTPEEIGAAENMMREPMNPLDEARTIARLAAEDESPESIAQRFGRTAQWVEQRMKLDRLAPKVKTAYRDGRITLGAAAAFTVASKAEQEAYIADAKAEWKLQEHYIRSHFAGQKIDAKAAIFPLTDYPAECISRDLFSDHVFLTNATLFHELQRAAAAKVAEKLRGKGWSEVFERFSDAPTDFSEKYVQIYTKIPAAERGKFVAYVLYNVTTGRVDVEEGYALRKDAKKIKLGDSPDADKVDAADVPPADCYSLSGSQENMIAFQQTRGIAEAIDKGDTWLALKTILSPLLTGARGASPAWCGLTEKHVNWTGANSLLDQPIEPPVLQDDSFPDRAAFEAMPWPDVMRLVRIAALRSMELMYRPSAEAARDLEASNIEWFRLDEAFLRRFRFDALKQLGNLMAVEAAGPKKSDLVAALASHTGKPVLPIDWTKRDEEEKTRAAARAA